MTRALVPGRLEEEEEEEGTGVDLVRVGAAGTSYSPSRASMTPWKRPSCCRKSCSTLERRVKEREQLIGKETGKETGERRWKQEHNLEVGDSVKSSQIYLYGSFFTERD